MCNFFADKFWVAVARVADHGVGAADDGPLGIDGAQLRRGIEQRTDQVLAHGVFWDGSDTLPGGRGDERNDPVEFFWCDLDLPATAAPAGRTSTGEVWSQDSDVLLDGSASLLERLHQV